MSRPNRVAWAPILVVSLILSRAGAISAHGFGQRYDLPVPLWLYVTGAGVAVVFSFVVVGVFVRRTHRLYTYPRLDLLRSPLGRFLAHPALLFCLQFGSVVLFVLLILTGLFGNQTPTKNLAPTLVWIIWWTGLAYISALLGNFWALINPWKILFGWAEALYRRLAPGSALSHHTPYPKALGVWPGVLLFFAFAWVELVFRGSAVPANLAAMALIYSAITWTGMYVFGREQWLRHGEAFSLAFGLLSRFAPTEIRVLDADVCRACDLACRDDDGECIDCYACFRQAQPTQRQWNLRPYAVGLLRTEAISLSQMAFVLLLLATVTFDGFMATSLWADIERAIYAVLPDLGGARLTVVRTLGLVVAPALFLQVYVVVSALMAAVSGGRFSAGSLARVFVFALVPIALAYHMAHYLSLLLVQGQLMIPLASDPFGFGWNLLGTGGYRTNIGVVGARFGWYTAVIAIVVGHIIAVYLAHIIALRTLRDRPLALRSQYPMLVLMVAYTVVSLWILAQPLVESRMSAATSAAMVRAMLYSQASSRTTGGQSAANGIGTAAHLAVVHSEAVRAIVLRGMTMKGQYAEGSADGKKIEDTW